MQHAAQIHPGIYPPKKSAATLVPPDTREYVIKALFNKNTLKLVVGGICVLITSFLIAYVIPLKNDIVKIILTVCVGAVVYIVSSALLKEDLVYSFIRKKNK